MFTDRSLDAYNGALRFRLYRSLYESEYVPTMLLEE